VNTSQLKSYAPAARQAFIAAVTAQAARLGITAKETSPATVQGDVLLVNGQAFPRSAESGRNKLIARVKALGFEATMDAVAYTWFNRLVAIRYMELHNYLDHGYRVLSDPSGSGRPEILDRAADVELPGLERSKAIQLKLDGTKDEELYRMLLMAQCNALHKAMPFLFEKIGDGTELLLPANLLHTDSLIRRLVEDIEESAWDQIEIIGWLYQFYISEKKDQVIGKVVKSEDIPAATQLFTPNWIVKYMVQNSLGAQWLATYPASPLKGQMEYYIEPAEQTEEVNAQLAVITPAALNPEEITLIDPACGSGHILVEAYDLFKAIYLERGYRERDAAQLILTKNLYGLDIDQRAAQLSGFALMMKGRADDRRLFKRGLKLNVIAVVNSGELELTHLTHGLKVEEYGLCESDLQELKRLFQHATTFGSLIQVPQQLARKLPELHKLSEEMSDDMFVAAALKRLEPLVSQASILAGTYGNVVANPPFMGSKSQPPVLKKHLNSHFNDYKSDFFSAFIIRNLLFSEPGARLGLMTPQVWMFLSSYRGVRSRLINQDTILSLIQPEYNAFWDSAHVTICSFIVQKVSLNGYIGSFVRLTDFYGAELQPTKALEAIKNPDCGWMYRAKPDNFSKIPGCPIAYWVGKELLRLFATGTALQELAKVKAGMASSNDDRFLRYWSEVDLRHTALAKEHTGGCHSRTLKWFPYNKGGGYRRWFGYQSQLINWENDGREIKQWVVANPNDPNTTHWSRRITNTEYFFQECITWGDITSSEPSFRYLPSGFVIGNRGPIIITDTFRFDLLAYLNTKICSRIFGIVNPSLALNVGNVAITPFQGVATNSPWEQRVKTLIALSRDDWNAYERSWDFESPPILAQSFGGSLESSYNKWLVENKKTITEMKSLEEENNRLFIDAYGLENELTPGVPIEQITITVNPAYRYGIKGTEEERQTRFREDTIQELVSYAIGCLMGRYSLDEPGLIYAHSGNAGFDPSRYAKFPADEDGILPVTDSAWFEDDAANRLAEFISVAWDAAHLEENLTYLAANLSPGKNETSRDSLRRYLCDRFFKDHLKTYKNRPIYWLFSSGKQKAFQCLVYLHRYNEGTLSRMRSEYVIPLQGKMAARLAHLEEDLKDTSSAQQKRIEKESAKLKKQQTELLAFDEKLRHYADQRITLDLDDGVKVNYGKFGALLVEVATVHGQKAEGP
jgi:type II restriction/modification system DNA methylase subunit YeeA